MNHIGQWLQCKKEEGGFSHADTRPVVFRTFFSSVHMNVLIQLLIDCCTDDGLVFFNAYTIFIKLLKDENKKKYKIIYTSKADEDI